MKLIKDDVERLNNLVFIMPWYDLIYVNINGRVKIKGVSMSILEPSKIGAYRYLAIYNYNGFAL